MARKPRIFVPHAPYHVYCRVGRGEAAFACRDERDHWIDTVREVVRDHRISVSRWLYEGLLLRSSDARFEEQLAIVTAEMEQRISEL